MKAKEMEPASSELQLGCHSCHSTRRNNAKRTLYGVVNQLQEQVVRAHEWVPGGIRHLHGPLSVDYSRDELVVLCIGRDAELWIRSFIEHHLALGAKHIFFLDNGSRDATVALASAYKRVSVFGTDISFGHFEVGLRRWLTRTFARNRWSIYCDVDELFDYPCSDRLSLSDLLGYLDRYGYQAVTGQMLDLFSDKPFSELHSSPDDSLKDKYRFYDLSDLVPTRDVYWIRDGQLDSAEIVCNFGGIRKRFFGDDCLLLTKHPLVFADDSVGLYTYDGHFMTGARVADISTVLLHYKYVDSLPERARKSVEWVNAELYRGLSDVLGADPDLCLRLETATELHSLQQLVDAGFLTTTERYLRWVEEHEQ